MQILDDDGAPSLALTAFCRNQGFSLDWLFRGEVRGLVLRVHRAASNHMLNTGFKDEDEGTTVEAVIVAQFLRTDARQGKIIETAASERLMGKPLGEVLWQIMADIDSLRTLTDHPKTEGRA